MEQFEELIEKLKPINAHQIEYFYVQLFAKSSLRLLIKLGVREGEVYPFDERKKRLRQLDKYYTGMSFKFYDKAHGFDSYGTDRLEFDDKFVEFTRYNADYFNGEYFENCGIAQLFDMEWWERIYNYLRIEANSKPKDKSKKTTKEK